VAVAAAVAAAADPAFLARIADLIKGQPYWEVYRIVRAELQARPLFVPALTAMRAELFASALGLVDQLIEVA
jgi:hypothetical protein